MNIRELVKIEAPLEAEAARVLRSAPGITAVVTEVGTSGKTEAVLEFSKNRIRTVVEFRKRVNAATAWQLVQLGRARPDIPLLVIAGETTADARAILQEQDIAVVDGLGNAHIQLRGLLLHVEGRTARRPGRSPSTRLKGKAGLAAQALMLHPDRAWTVKALVQEASISAGLSHRVLSRLHDEGIIESEGSGPNLVRHVADATALLDLWAEESVEQPVRKLGYLLAQTPRQLLAELGGNLESSGITYALTGAAAASLLAPFVTAIPVVEVWVIATAAPEQLFRGAQADPVEEGHNIVFLQAKDDAPLAFRQPIGGLWVANRFRIYAELRRDPRRGREQADHLRAEVIGF